MPAERVERDDGTSLPQPRPPTSEACVRLPVAGNDGERIREARDPGQIGEVYQWPPRPGAARRFTCTSWNMRTPPARGVGTAQT